MPRIRNWKELTFYRPSKQTEYVHIDALFGEPGKNVIVFDLIEAQFRHLMRVAVSVREGAVSSSTLLKRLRSGSRKNATYAAFSEVGRVIRTVQLLRYLSDAPLRRRVTAATNKVESFNRFSQWIGFGNRGVNRRTQPPAQLRHLRAGRRGYRAGHATPRPLALTRLHEPVRRRGRTLRRHQLCEFCKHQPHPVSGAVSVASAGLVVDRVGRIPARRPGHLCERQPVRVDPGRLTVLLVSYRMRSDLQQGRSRDGHSDDPAGQPEA
jgi:hypothetical protein